MLRKLSLVLVLALSLTLCACARNLSQDELYGKLFAYLAESGYPCELVENIEMPDPAIYDASVWRAISAGGETVYVYFDESNRADYLLSLIVQEQYGFATRYGLRFVLNYRGTDEGLLAALGDMNNDE